MSIAPKWGKERRRKMFYYKAEATFTINGAEVTLNGCKASERKKSSSENRISPVEAIKSGIERRCSIAARIGFIEKSISERRSEIALL